MKPVDCIHCSQYRCCTSGMYLEDCLYYKPEDKPVTLIEKLKSIFKVEN